MSAVAQSEDIFGCFPFAERAVFTSACLRTFFARLSSFCASFAGLDAAWSMRSVARLRFVVTLAGIA